MPRYALFFTLFLFVVGYLPEHLSVQGTLTGEEIGYENNQSRNVQQCLGSHFNFEGQKDKLSFKQTLLWTAIQRS